MKKALARFAMRFDPMGRSAQSVQKVKRRNAMSYTEAIFWYASWPVVIYIAYKFVRLNLGHAPKDND